MTASLGNKLHKNISRRVTSPYWAPPLVFGIGMPPRYEWYYDIKHARETERYLV